MRAIESVILARKLAEAVVRVALGGDSAGLIPSGHWSGPLPKGKATGNGFLLLSMAIRPAIGMVLLKVLGPLAIESGDFSDHP